MKNSAAYNACATLLGFLLLVLAVGAATNGQGTACFGLVATTVGVALTIDFEALKPKWELDIVESHPALGEPWTGLSSTVGDEQVAFTAITHRPLEVYSCVGTPDFYVGLDCFGNEVTVQDGIVTHIMPRSVSDRIMA